MITIRLTAEKGASSGVNYNKYVKAYFDGFVPTGFPYILGGANTFEGEQIVLLDELAPKPEETRALVLDGEDFFYYFTGHDLSGTLERVRLSTLGSSYNDDDGSFATGGDGLIRKVSTMVEISGLSISNPPEEEGALHQVIVALMGGGGHEGGEADPGLLFTYVNGEAQKLIGSTKGDTYSGTVFGDRISGGKGADKLKGRGGDDLIDGGLDGDTLWGGADADRFAFSTRLGASNVDRIKDFVVGEDTIRLDDKVFKALDKGPLDDDAFVIGANAATDDHHIVYDAGSGALLYDSDGAGGKAAVQFAVLAKSLSLDADSFLVV